MTRKKFEMPETLPQQVHQALKDWTTQNSETGWSNLLIVQQADEGRGQHLIVNQILNHGLEQLKKIDLQGADLLERRFLNRETAQEVAYSLNLSPDIIYQRQRGAIQRLAQVIWDQEVDLRRLQAQKIQARLEPATYTRLFGVDEKIETVRTMLEVNTDPWLLALEGMGGMGKTSLADALARELSEGNHFREIAWISVRQRLFRLSGEVESLPATPGLTLAELVDRLIDQLELAPLKHQPDREKLVGVKGYLKSCPCLIVVDNLETVTDYHALVPQLRDLSGPSKFLITTRYSLQGESGVCIYHIEGLSPENSRALIRHEAKNQGLGELVQASDAELDGIYQATGGNPLAMKLVIGQVHTFPLPAILERLHTAKGQPTHQLLNFIYADAWQSLDPKAQRIMQALLLAPDEGSRLEQLSSTCQLNSNETAGCLYRLVTLSLVQIQGGLNERRYGLHQLTRAFVTRQTEASESDLQR